MKSYFAITSFWGVITWIRLDSATYKIIQLTYHLFLLSGRCSVGNTYDGHANLTTTVRFWCGSQLLFDEPKGRFSLLSLLSADKNRMVSSIASDKHRLTGQLQFF